MWDNWRVRIGNKIRQNRIGCRDPANRVSVSMAVGWYKNLMWQHRGSPIDTILYTPRSQPAGSSSVPAFSKTVFESHRFCGFYINPRNLCCDQIESRSTFSVFISCVVCCWFFLGAGFWGFNKELDTSEVRTPNPSPHFFCSNVSVKMPAPGAVEGLRHDYSQRVEKQKVPWKNWHIHVVCPMWGGAKCKL